MQDLIQIQNTPAKLSVNFEALRDALAKELKQYEVVVTADTVKDAKALATELNKTKAAIADRRKAEVAQASAPIKAFDERMKELETMCDEGRKKLLRQVEKFEDETRETCRMLLDSVRSDLWSERGVAAEFQKASIEDLVMVSNVTAKGNLTAKARAELDARIVMDLRVQDQTERRLLELENASYKAGLSAPLTRDHVRPFLFSDYETYDRELTRILEAEVRRQEQAEAAMRERIEREARQKVEAEQREKERQERAQREAELASKAREAAQKAAESPKKAPEEPVAKQPLGGLPRDTQWEKDPAPPGKITLTVVAVFRPEVDPAVSNETVEKALRDAMLKAGIKTLKEITIHRPQTRDAA